MHNDVYTQHAHILTHTQRNIDIKLFPLMEHWNYCYKVKRLPKNEVDYKGKPRESPMRVSNCLTMVTRALIFFTNEPSSALQPSALSSQAKGSLENNLLFFLPHRVKPTFPFFTTLGPISLQTKKRKQPPFF